MSQTLNAAIAVIGIDIGKNSFHIVGHDERGAIVLRQKWSRGQVEARLANMPPCLIGMEACVGAHHLSLKLRALGHDARLMPAKYVRPYSKGQRMTSAMPRQSPGRCSDDHEVRGDQDHRSAGPAGTAPGTGASGQPAYWHYPSDPRILATSPDVLSPRMLRISLCLPSGRRRHGGWVVD
jgi:hypothetical protein